MPLKITHLTTVHPRYDVRIFSRICCSLAKEKKFEVNLVVSDGMGNEIKDGVNIFDVGLVTGSRLYRIINTSKLVCQKALELNSEIYHFHDPEFIPTALKLKRLKKKVIFDIHEIYSLQILEKKWIPYFFRKFISLSYVIIENYACKKFDLLIVPQEAMAQKYSKLKKTIFIGNFPIKKVYLGNDLPKINKYKLLYSGTISETRGIWNMLDLILELQKYSNKYRLNLAGDLSKPLFDKIRTHKGWEFTDYLGFLPKEDIYQKYNENSVGLILFNNVGQYYLTYSLKLFEYMQAGMLILMPNFGDWISFNEKYKVGINVEPSNAKQVASSLDRINPNYMEILSSHNKKIVEEYFNWESQEIKLFNVYYQMYNNTH